MIQKVYHYLVKDKVFFIASIFACLSIFFVPISKDYLTYINYPVLVVMFGLMFSVAGMTDAHFFTMLAVKLVKHLKNLRTIILTMVLASFFLGMLLTNDAVLLTLIPFMLFVMAKVERPRESILLVILMTLAANLGSALTPMGDPQNIYLYTHFDISFWTFIQSTSLITITGFILLILTIFLVFKMDLVKPIVEDIHVTDKRIYLYFFTFLLSILTVLSIMPLYITFPVVLVIGLLFNPKLFKKVDYHLLLTFFMFFIFTGNVSKMDVMINFFSPILNSSDHVFFVSIVTSQFISNVPAAVLLSTFTPNSYILELLQGVNVGAMGTIIGSLASLITFKFVLKMYPERFKEYLIKYTIICLIYMSVIIAVIYLFK